MFRYLTLLLVLTIVCESWAVPKPMESIENYNVMLLHGAYGDDQGFLDVDDTSKTKEAYFATSSLDNGACLGRYHENTGDQGRLLYWLSHDVFEEPYLSKGAAHPKNSYIYSWRSFSKPANSSINNAIELGDRTWNLSGTDYEKRRALVEEAQEVKVEFVNDSGKVSYGQEALDSIRKNPNLYHQLASRYILIGHSMGGVVAREYVQNSDYYHGDVDKIITLDSPHEGTGAQNMQLGLLFFCLISRRRISRG